jgi:hypothetical protein
MIGRNQSNGFRERIGLMSASEGCDDDDDDDDVCQEPQGIGVQ